MVLVTRIVCKHHKYIGIICGYQHEDTMGYKVSYKPNTKHLQIISIHITQC